MGKARYGLMLREDGIVMDDGTTSRLAADHYVMTTTTANAAKVMSHMEFCHQAHWPELDVQYVSVTEQWATFPVVGIGASKAPSATPSIELVRNETRLRDGFGNKPDEKPSPVVTTSSPW